MTIDKYPPKIACGVLDVDVTILEPDVWTNIYTDEQRCYGEHYLTEVYLYPHSEA